MSFTFEIVSVTTTDAATVVVSVTELVLEVPPVDDCVTVCVDELCP